jgi:hypothetical protein
MNARDITSRLSTYSVEVDNQRHRTFTSLGSALDYIARLAALTGDEGVVYWQGSPVVVRKERQP